jgi:hypothetical protein
MTDISNFGVVDEQQSVVARMIDIGHEPVDIGDVVAVPSIPFLKFHYPHYHTLTLILCKWFFVWYGMIMVVLIALPE